MSQALGEGGLQLQVRQRGEWAPKEQQLQARQVWTMKRWSPQERR
jgi:hypothetical protein